MADQGESLSAKFGALNTIPLDGLKARLDALRAQAEADLKKAGVNPNQTATPADIAKAASAAGLTVEQFMAALEKAKGLAR
ncbi:MAG: hypothetical protein ACOYMW_11440 [Candidatus Competibacteraceae bacterium]